MGGIERTQLAPRRDRPGLPGAADPDFPVGTRSPRLAGRPPVPDRGRRRRDRAAVCRWSSCRTVNQIRYVTDSNGIVAFDEPGLMGQKVFFHVKSHGYEFPKDGFGNRGVALETQAGGSARIKIKRLNIADGSTASPAAGIYRDSLLLGHARPDRRAAAERSGAGAGQRRQRRSTGASSTGSGATPTGRAIRWAISTCPARPRSFPAGAGSIPSAGVNLTYFVDEDGFARPTCEMPGAGPTWITGLVVLRDRQGKERMFANYVKIRPPMETYQRGLVEFDAETQHVPEAGRVSAGPGRLRGRASRRPHLPPPGRQRRVHLLL